MDGSLLQVHHERGALWATDLQPGEELRFSLPEFGVPVVLEEAGSGDAAALGLAMGGWSAGEVLARVAAGKRCFVARMGGDIAAYGWLTPGWEWIGELDRSVRLDPDEAYIWHCATVPAYQRRGLYTALVAAMLVALSAEGCRRVWIGAAVANAPSVRAFTTLGLRPVVMVDYRRLGPASCFYLAAFSGADPAAVAHARAALASPQEHVCGPVRIRWGPRPRA